jgi:hypothetical protein
MRESQGRWVARGGDRVSQSGENHLEVFPGETGTRKVDGRGSWRAGWGKSCEMLGNRDGGHKQTFILSDEENTFSGEESLEDRQSWGW